MALTGLIVPAALPEPSLSLSASMIAVLNCDWTLKSLGPLCKNILAWALSLEILMLLVWGEDQKSVFLESSPGVQM